MRETHFSFVLEAPVAETEAAKRHFQSKLTFETDAWDVKTDMERGRSDFVVIDVRSRADFEARRIAGSIHLAYRSMDAETTAHLPKDKVMVTYCWGPGCNASTKGALKLALLGFRVKEMIGGLEYWIKEGGPIEGTLVDEADRSRELCGVSSAY
jgi:rhodanese-related sulfurtransferase